MALVALVALVADRVGEKIRAALSGRAAMGANLSYIFLPLETVLDHEFAQIIAPRPAICRRAETP